MRRGISKPKVLAAFLLVSLASIMLLASTSLRAHPPSNIELNYNGEKEVLRVVVSHSVGNPSAHYVEAVTVTRNGEGVVEEEYDKQAGRSESTYEYQLGAENGDTFEVEAVCNRFGNITGTLTVKGLPVDERSLLHAGLSPESSTLTVDDNTPSSARGIAVVLLDPAENSLQYTLSFKGLSGPATGADLIKDGAEGQVILPVFGKDEDTSPEPPESNSGFITGAWGDTSTEPLTDELVTAILEGEVYVRVKTELNPEGELLAPLEEVE